MAKIQKFHKQKKMEDILNHIIPHMTKTGKIHKQKKLSYFGNTKYDNTVYETFVK